MFRQKQKYKNKKGNREKVRKKEKETKREQKARKNKQTKNKEKSSYNTGLGKGSDSLPFPQYLVTEKQ